MIRTSDYRELITGIGMAEPKAYSAMLLDVIICLYLLASRRKGEHAN